MYMSLFLLRGNFSAKIKRLFPIHHRFLLVIEEPSFQGGKVTHRLHLSKCATCKSKETKWIVNI